METATLNYSAALSQAQMSQQSSQLTALGSSAGTSKVRSQDERSIDAVSQQFAAVFVTQMLNIMYEDVKVDPVFGGGHAEETFRSMLLDEYGKNIGNAGGLGIADMVKNQLLKYQEQGSAV